jgi:hypothetical protein
MSDFALAIESVEELLDYEVLESKFENGAEQRRLKHTSALIGWRCKSPALVLAGMTAYRDFFTGKYGSLTSFTWTSHIDGVEYTVKFSKGSFRVVRDEGHFRVTWDFERVI